MLNVVVIIFVLLIITFPFATMWMDFSRKAEYQAVENQIKESVHEEYVKSEVSIEDRALLKNFFRLSEDVLHTIVFCHQTLRVFGSYRYGSSSKEAPFIESVFEMPTHHPDLEIKNDLSLNSSESSLTQNQSQIDTLIGDENLKGILKIEHGTWWANIKIRNSKLYIHKSWQCNSKQFIKYCYLIHSAEDFV